MNRRARGEIFYDRPWRRIVYRREAPTSSFWDSQWIARIERDALVKLPGGGTYVTNTTRRFLPNGSKVLEGGCGTGVHSRHLVESGFVVHSLDWAKETVNWLLKRFPETNPVIGDVRKVPFPQDYFDGYWSLGVIEHFYEGYEEIAAEMARVIRPGGFLFLTFPHMSPLRKFMASVGYFPSWREEMRSDFYQFALDKQTVVKSLEQSFALVHESPMLGLSGLADTFPWLEPVAARLRTAGRVGRVVAGALDRILRPVSSHIVLLVLIKKAA